MKKWLILILLGFVLTSIYAFSYTNQIIGSFNNFDEDNGNGGEDDSVEGSLIYPKITSQKSKVKIIWNNTYTATGTTHQIEMLHTDL